MSSEAGSVYDGALKALTDEVYHRQRVRGE